MVYRPIPISDQGLQEPRPLRSITTNATASNPPVVLEHASDDDVEVVLAKSCRVAQEEAIHPTLVGLPFDIYSHAKALGKQCLHGTPNGMVWGRCVLASKMPAATISTQEGDLAS